MPDLIWFEWKRQLKGYRLETIDLDWFIREKVTDFMGYWVVHEVADKAPNWAHELIDAYDGPPKELASLFEYGGNLTSGNICLVPNSPFETEIYNPLEMHPLLFMELANTEATVEGVLSFANKYGALHEHKTHYAEPKGFFQVAHLPRHLMSSIHMILGLRKATSAWFEYKESGNTAPLLALLPDGPDLKVENEEFVIPAFGQRVASLQYKIRVLPGTNKPVMYLSPENLQSCIWIQFLQAVTNDTQLKQCAACPTWFSYGTGTGRRRSAQYCSDSCRKVSHAQSKARKSNG
ncbi:MAG: hypothetical protein HOF94_02070 [Alphaproteobacteria bacterium]|jgi:hypothetical protein|nr:hypothetical protein [Alphaproteobacteria bacterium]